MSKHEISIKSREVLQKMKPYSPGKPTWEVQEELGIERVVKLASNENPLGASPKAMEAIQNYLSQIHRYPDAAASTVKERIASKLGQSPDRLIMTNGADELITLISEAYLNPKDEIIVPAPSFSEYEFGAQLMGAITVEVPLGENYCYDVNAILQAVTERTKIVYICSPHNPAGTYLPKQELDRLVEALPKHILVVIDSAYSHYATADDYINGLEYVTAEFPVIVLQTFSKIYGLAGIRIGFGVSTEAIIRNIVQVKEPFNVNALAQTAAAAAIMDEDHVAASREMNTNGRKFLYTALCRLGLHFIESMSNFVLVQLGPEARSIYDRLLAKGVIVRYGSIWGLPEHVRITVGSDEENEILIESLRVILEEDIKR